MIPFFRADIELINGIAFYFFAVYMRFKPGQPSYFEFSPDYFFQLFPEIILIGFHEESLLAFYIGIHPENKLALDKLGSPEKSPVAAHRKDKIVVVESDIIQ